jgi:hypothetical protein
MNVANPIADKVLDRLQAANGPIFSVSDFLDLGPRPTVDQALSRLARQGKINRVRRGLYELPRIGKLLNRPITQSPDALARAWARKNGLRIVASGRTLRICWDSLRKSRRRLLITQTGERRRLS